MSANTAKALPNGSAGGDKVGIGASIALNLIEDSTKAQISQNASVAGAKDVTVNAVSSDDTYTEAVAGAAGGIAIDAVVALTKLQQTASCNS